MTINAPTEVVPFGPAPDPNEVAEAGFTELAPAPGRPVTDAVKRLMDIVGAGAALVLFSPVLIVAAALVRLTSKGPALFWQERYGKDESIFRVV